MRTLLNRFSLLLILVMSVCTASDAATVKSAGAVGKILPPISLANVKKTPIGALYDYIATMPCYAVDAMIHLQEQSLPKDVSVDDLHLLQSVQTYAVATRCALNEKTKADMYAGQLSGMVTAVNDPHSQFMDEEESTILRESAEGEFFGIGAQLESIMIEGKFSGVRIVAPLPGTPADKAGLKAKDVVYMIGNKKTDSYKNLRDAIVDIKGPLGTSVILTLIREGEEKPLVVTVPRDRIEQKYVKTELLPNNWAWMRVIQFMGHKTFCTDIKNQYNALEKASLAKNEPLKGLILDLRNDPGGLLGLAFCAATTFAPPSVKGRTMLAIEMRDGVNPIEESKFTPLNLLNGKPLVVLVNEGSASASEIVAKVCQAQGYCTVVGTDTFGKGSIQRVFPLAGEKVSVKVTYAQYLVFHSSGALVPVQGVGVIPNIRVKVKRAETNDNTDVFRKRESDLQGSLPTSKYAKDILPENTKEMNPTLYQQIVDALSSEPLKLELE